MTARRAGDGSRARYDDPARWGQHIDDKVMDAWWGSRAGSDIAVPIGTVAALALVRRQPQLTDGGGGLELGAEIEAMTPENFGKWLQLAWGLYWFERPDLVERARPLHEWLHADDRGAPRRLKAAHHVALAAIRAGILELVSVDRLRHDVDLFGALIEQMRGKADKRARGDFYTPRPVADGLAALLVRDSIGELVRHASAGAMFTDPAAGSGGLFRAAADELRDRGLDPADCAWRANDVDPVAAGTCAVNVMLWDLGPDSLVGCFDSLTDPDGMEEARAEALAWLAERDTQLSQLRMLAAVRHAQFLVSEFSRANSTEPSAASSPDATA
ncbi:N-6 DNA methylase [Yinghuangia sp. YIM S10712]|uniref:N-6 DNA methylase n=1 Tax=Yinghuangia sp. YIM S10712 TaxID=3436930 RepID=UPI003F52B38F